MDLWWFLLGCFRFLEPLAPSTQQQHGSQRLRTRPQSLLTFVNGILEYLPPSVARWPRSWHSRSFHGGRDRGVLAWQPNQYAPAAEGCPVCSTSRFQPPTWCDLLRCREMITKLHFEGVRRDIPGPTASTTTGRGVSPRHPEFLHGTNPSTGHHWTAFLCPVIRRRRRHFGITTGEN